MLVDDCGDGAEHASLSERGKNQSMQKSVRKLCTTVLWDLTCPQEDNTLHSKHKSADKIK